jgi:hypothetical protein
MAASHAVSMRHLAHVPDEALSVNERSLVNADILVVISILAIAAFLLTTNSCRRRPWSLLAQPTWSIRNSHSKKLGRIDPTLALLALFMRVSSPQRSCACHLLFPA